MIPFPLWSLVPILILLLIPYFLLLWLSFWYQFFPNQKKSSPIIPHVLVVVIHCLHWLFIHLWLLCCLLFNAYVIQEFGGNCLYISEHSLVISKSVEKNINSRWNLCCAFQRQWQSLLGRQKNSIGMCLGRVGDV